MQIILDVFNIIFQTPLSWVQLSDNHILKQLLIYMFLIENYSIVTRNQIPNQILLNSFQQIKQNTRITFSNNQRYQLLSIHHQLNYSFNILNNLTISTTNSTIAFKFIPLEVKLSIIKSRLVRLILLRKALAKNSTFNNLNFFIDPITGQHFLRSIHLNPTIQLLKVFVEQYCQSLPFEIKQIFKQYTNIFRSINELYLQDQQFQQIKQQKKGKENFIIQDDIININTYFKKYIMHSPYYTWSVLSNNTREGFFKEDCLAQTRASIDFLTKKLIKNSQVITKITNIHTNSIQSINSLQFNTYQQDLQVKMKYLNLVLAQRQNAPFLKNININTEFLQIIQQKDQIRISSQQGFVYIKVHKYSSEYTHLLQYQKEILHSMPRFEFPGLPRYYFVRNLQSQVSNYRFSNLSSTINFDKYIQGNESTMSLQTKINIFTQIILTLRYIRNQGIVFLNLLPANIYLKKGQLTRLFDFTNSYCSKTKLKITQKNKIPYVLIDKELQKEEKADIFSFGSLLYKSLFEKHALNIRQSHMQYMTSSEYIQKLEQKIIAVEATDFHKLGMIKLLNYFCLSCIGWKDKPIKNSFEDLPFLDWGVVLIKYLQIYLQYKIL